MQLEGFVDADDLAKDLPDLRALGAQACAEFEVTPLQNANVAWLNSRWFSERGYAVQCDRKIRTRVEAWVLSQFAVRTLDTSRDRDHLSRVVFADRYGDVSGSSPHGGSGRVATIGRFQVKGIGPTPLVGDATWIHSHGCMSLTEAICEAIFAEILDHELPFGAAPVIAIIDMREHFVPERESGDAIRRALVVRPAVLRPAHLLRAPLFVAKPGSPLAIPGSDAVRTTCAIRYLAAMSPVDRARLNLPRALTEVFERWAAQAATADVMRVFTGGLFAGNVSMDGAILDLGVARSMYSWAHVQLHAHTQGFGRDIERLVALSQTIQYYVAKAGQSDTPFFREQAEENSIRRWYSSIQDQIFGELWADEFMAPDSRTRIRAATKAYFESQQRIRLRERWDGKRPAVAWVYDSLFAHAPTSRKRAATPEWALLSLIRREIERVSSETPSAPALSWYRSVRMLRPRPELDRRRLELRIERAIIPNPSTARITSFIDNVVGRCRRRWRCPANLAVVSQRSKSGCSALEVFDANSSKRGWWLEGLFKDGKPVWGQEEVPAKELSIPSSESATRKWRCQVGYDALPSAIRRQLSRDPQLEYRGPPT